MTSISQSVFMLSKTRHTHTHDDSIRRNATHRISPKIKAYCDDLAINGFERGFNSVQPPCHPVCPATSATLYSNRFNQLTGHIYHLSRMLYNVVVFDCERSTRQLHAAIATAVLNMIVTRVPGQACIQPASAACRYCHRHRCGCCCYRPGLIVMH